MNKTDIDWTDFTLNVITGCRGPAGDGRHCPYCYAKRLALGRLRRLYLANRNVAAGDASDPFAPRFWPKRLEQPARLKKPSKIFVCSMGELFDPSLPHSWVQAVFSMIKANPHHTFQLLTHQPQHLHRFSPYPPNVWVGVTATDGGMALTSASWLAEVKAPVKFLSLEPLLGPIEPCSVVGLDWLIIGAQTGPGARVPEMWWVSNILKYAQTYRIPIFLKDNLKWPEKRQEFPEGVTP